MAKPSKPTEQVEKVIRKQKAIKSKGAKEKFEKALYIANTPVAKVREQLDSQSIFFLKVMSELENRIQVIGEETNGWLEISPDVYDAIYNKKKFEVERPGNKGVFTAVFRDGEIGKLSKTGEFTGLNFKELQKVKNYMLAEKAGDVEGGHQVALATQKLEVTLNVLESIDRSVLTSAEKQQVSRIINATKKCLDLLTTIDKIDAEVARKIFGGDKSAAIAVLDAIADGTVSEYKYETSSTNSTDFNKDALKQNTQIELEDKQINRFKGAASAQVIKAFNNILLKSLERTPLTDIEKEIANYVELGNSLSFIQAVEQNILHGAIGKKFNGGTSRKKQATRQDTLLSKKTAIRSKRLKAPRRIGGAAGQKNPFADAGKLLGFINKQLPNTIIKNMGRPGLENQTGRFARSAEVVSAIPDPRGLITFNYRYDDRYRVFEPEHNDGRYPSAYDPRDLISKSIRELAISQAQVKFITRRV